MKAPPFLSFHRRYEVDESHWLVMLARRQYHNFLLFLEWRGFPEDYEISFVETMKALEAKGLPFEKVIRATAPKVFGEDPAEVMLRWVGREARQDPIKFVKGLKREFGYSYAPTIMKLEKLADADTLQESGKPYVPADQYLVDAMIRNGLLEP